ncbi:TPA: RNA methyltransferase [Candidatus Micrarchaeota archaeon]|nr:RNA methyltransferase [Candidatus Micrarchaeota archaeon]
MFKKDGKRQKKVNARVILVEPEYQINLGMVARAMKNFGCDDLVLVKPKCKIGFTAKMFAKHAEDLLENRREYPSLQEAAKGCGIVVGTTARVTRFSDRLKNCVSSTRLTQTVNGRGKAALVFGSESNGLKEDDALACDVTAYIPSFPEQPVLNLSHAVAVTLYELSSKQAPEIFFETAASSKLKRLEQMFAQALADANALPGGKKVLDERKVSTAFRQALQRSNLADSEAQSLFAGLSRISAVCKAPARKPVTALLPASRSSLRSSRQSN